MVTKSVEERLQSLEDNNQKLKHEIERLQAINEIQNLMGRYVAIHTPMQVHKTWELYARHTPDTWQEIANWGVIEGFDNIKKVWAEQSTSMFTVVKGMMWEHDLATPTIVVAGDCKTAKATWTSPGHETKPPKAEDPRMQANWCWGKYAVDFVKEDGIWRIWHFKWFRTFLTPFGISWTDRAKEPELTKYVNFECIKKPSTYHKPYFVDEVVEAIPPAPQPYETWTEKDAYWFLTSAWF